MIGHNQQMRDWLEISRSSRAAHINKLGDSSKTPEARRKVANRRRWEEIEERRRLERLF